MNCRRFGILVLLSAILVALSGCGGSSSNGSFNPVPAANSVPSLGNTSSAVDKYTISLTVDRTSIDANVGQVLATATITSSNGASNAGLPVTFGVAAGPATVEPSLVTVPSDSNGKAVTMIAPGNVLSTTNVILVASATVNGQAIRSYAPFQIVRGTGAITFISGTIPSDPNGTLFNFDKTFEASFAGTTFEFMQQLPFKVTDANGNPRVGVPVELSIDNQVTGHATLSLSQPTVTSDSAGKGIFNVGVSMKAPPPGFLEADSIIYKAVTTEAGVTAQLVSYAGFVITMSTKLPPLVITPGTASFGSATDVQFSVAGGLKPYGTPTSSSPLVVVTMLNATTINAHCDSPALLTGSVSISVVDSAGGSATATVTK